MKLTGVLEWGQMAARPAGGAARAARSSGEAQGLSQKPRLPAQKVTLEPREFGRDSSRSWEEGSVSRISPSTSRDTGTMCSGQGRSKETLTPGTWPWGGSGQHSRGQAPRGVCVCAHMHVCVWVCVSVSVQGRDCGPASLAVWLWVQHSPSLSCYLVPHLGRGGHGAREGTGVPD